MLNSAKILNSRFWKAKILKSEKILNLGFWKPDILNSAKILNSGLENKNLEIGQNLEFRILES